MSRSSLASRLADLGELLVSPRRKRLNDSRPDGREFPDPTPMALPVGYEAPPTLRETMQRYIREELSVHARRMDLGTFDEESDFEPEDPDEIQLSGYEVKEYDFLEDVIPEPPAEPLVDDEVVAEPAEPASPPPEPQPPEFGT